MIILLIKILVIKYSWPSKAVDDRPGSSMSESRSFRRIFGKFRTSEIEGQQVVRITLVITSHSVNDKEDPVVYPETTYTSLILFMMILTSNDP